MYLLEKLKEVITLIIIYPYETYILDCIIFKDIGVCQFKASDIFNKFLCKFNTVRNAVKPVKIFA